jgi:hypothetical protein
MMKFVILREVNIKGKKSRKALVEWDTHKIVDELEKELAGAGKALEKVIAKFKKESIRIP